MFGEQPLCLRPSDVERPPVLVARASVEQRQGDGPAKLGRERRQLGEHGRNGVVAEAGEVGDVNTASLEVRPRDQRVRVDDVEDRRGDEACDDRSERKQPSPPGKTVAANQRNTAPSQTITPTA